MNNYKDKKMWVISGVDDVAKDEAKRLAKVAKMKIGPWLTKLILNNGKSVPSNENTHVGAVNDVERILKNQEELLINTQELQKELTSLSFNLRHSPRKKSFLDKFFG